MTKRIKEIKRGLTVVTSIVHQKRPYTFVKVLAKYHGTMYGDVGFSKVCWPDWWNPQRGVDIATGRALNDIAKRIQLESQLAVYTSAKDYTQMLRENLLSRDVLPLS